MNNFLLLPSFLPSSCRENQKRETSSQSDHSPLFGDVLWVHGAWENGDHVNILMRGRGFREISKLTYHSERAKHVRNRNQNHSNPVQISFLYWRRPAAGQGPVGPSSPGRRPVFQTTKSQRYVRFENVNNFILPTGEPKTPDMQISFL